MLRFALALIGVLACTPLAQAARRPSAAAVPKRLESSQQPVLPPVQQWDGASHKWLAPADDPWITPSEKSGLTRTPSYDETVAWLRRLCGAAPDLEMVSIGRSPEGRDIWMVIASRGGGFEPEAVRATGRPILLVQAGIHSGEIDGKDAGLMLLRDLTVGGKQHALLDHASMLFIPVLNVDGHERSSPYGRINQRGPESTGWRTTARNLNLNRDYAKLDAPETRAVVETIVRWDPDLYLDLHVTDGADCQYDITFGSNGEHAWSPQAARWLATVLTPALHDDLKRMGHVPGPFLWPLDEMDPSRGFLVPTAAPRWSNGYGDARHLPTVLVENHSLKPYDRRVLGTYVLLATALRTLGEHGAALREAARADRARRSESVPLEWKVPDAATRTRMEYLGIGWRQVFSPVSGATYLEWTGEPLTLQVEVVRDTEPVKSVTRPHAYWIPPAWSDVAARLAVHGVAMERIDSPREVAVEMYRITSARLDSTAYEGHVRVTPRTAIEKQRRVFPAGSTRVSTDQPLGDLTVLLLEPLSPDSFFQWGFFLEVLPRTEYAEAYVMEPMAERMLAESPELRAEFYEKLRTDAAFAADARARLDWFYARTPFYDAEAGLYPIARE